ncbi:MAG: alpha/beta hydrolase [Rickettsiales bacterium]|jgi:alpha/beta superfamily hydrolase|nr:alpha/beta hydrolase [Rickettsiales bacterium]
MDIILTGAGGRIQASYHRNGNPSAPVAVVFHDNPAMNGHMNEGANYTLFYAFMQMGFNVVRFNFRGVGGTEGQFENGEAELTDASTVVDWIQERHENASGFWLAGHGFGAWIAMQMLMRRIEITGYVSVALPPKKFDFSFFNPAPVDGLIVAAGADDAAPEDSLKSFAASINRQRAGRAEFASVRDANHHFDGRLKELFSIVTKYLGARSIDRAAA